MKTKDLQNALTNVDDKYIAEAASYKSSVSKTVKVWRAIAIAACCLLAIPVTVLGVMMISDATGAGHGKVGSSQAAYDADYYYEATTAAETRAASNYSAGGYVYEDAAEYEYEEPAMAAGDSGYGYSEESAMLTEQYDASTAKIIRTADIDIQSTEYDDAIDRINALVEELNGYYESRSLNDGSGYRSANLSIRVPAEYYDTFIERLHDAGTVTSLYESADDVTASYRDIESRLETAKTKLARLQELLSQAEDMSDIITIEGAISDTEYEIDYLQGCLNGYDSRVSYSTVYIYLREVYKVQNPEAPLTFSERLSRAFSEGLENFGEAMSDIAIWLAESWLVLLIIGIFIALSIIIPISCVRAAKKKRSK